METQLVATKVLQIYSALSTFTAWKCPYSSLFWSTFSRIWTDCGEVQSISSYLTWMWENANQNNSEYGHLLRRDYDLWESFSKHYDINI